MKNKIIYVDFVSKNVRTNPIENCNKKGLVTSLWERFRKIFNLYEEPSKTKSQVYNYKHMM